MKPNTPKKKTYTGWNAVESVAFAAFVFWTIAGLYFISNHITSATIAKWAMPPILRDFVHLCLDNGDPILILLAFINTHLHAARQWSSVHARQWAVIVVVCAYVIELTGILTGLPFGDYYYTGNFGPMIYGVPLVIPLAWHVIVTNALFVVRSISPYASQMIEAAAAALICTVYDFILEPFATTVKHYWTWKGDSIPDMNYVSWFVLTALIIRFFSPTLSTRYRFDPRPLLILLMTVAIFIAGELKLPPSEPAAEKSPIPASHH